MKRLITISLCLVVILAALALAGGQAGAETVVEATEDATSSAVGIYGDEADYSAGVVDIDLGETVSVSGDGVEVDGNVVCITASGVYRLSGVLSEGRLEVDAKGKVYLEFDGVDITSGEGPALSVKDADKLTITLVADSVNALSDTDSSDTSAVLLSNDTVVINGAGSLLVTSHSGSAISSDDDILISGGVLELVAADEGLEANDAITINGGEVSVSVGGDGLRCRGAVTVNEGTLVSFGGTSAGGVGIRAFGAFTINGGTVIVSENAFSAPASESSQCSVLLVSNTVQPAGTMIVVQRGGEQVLDFAPDRAYRNVLVSMSGLVYGAPYEVTFGDGPALTTVAFR